jgi:sugar (pentulose or hexulose) kinase
MDLGTSGCRAVAISESAEIIAQARTDLPAPRRVESRGVEQDPHLWWAAALLVLRELSTSLGSHKPVGLCLDGTSATLMLCAPNGKPLGPALMYNDTRSDLEAERIAQAAPADSPARGAGSSLAKALYLARILKPPQGTLALHQADWLLGRLTGRFGVSDWNNALKLGYDPVSQRWPGWVSRLMPKNLRLPRVYPAGSIVGQLGKASAFAAGLPEGMPIAVGTTDSTAAVIATGARYPGDAVTCLGSTLVLKILARHPLASPEHGVYSHRLGDLWLAGGASNSGGAVLRRFFDDARMAKLSTQLNPDAPTGLDYYPLPAPGERFPVSNPTMQPRLSPRPADDVRFFQGMLEGIASVEQAGYRLLRSLGAPPTTRVLSIGGGANNAGWTRIRQRMLGVTVDAVAGQEAAYGAALLARRSTANT